MIKSRNEAHGLMQNNSKQLQIGHNYVIISALHYYNNMYCRVIEVLRFSDNFPDDWRSTALLTVVRRPVTVQDADTVLSLFVWILPFFTDVSQCPMISTSAVIASWSA